jgi:hypothetical protein
MTWTEGVTQISDTIFIGCGYSGLILSVVFILISIITIILLCVAFGTLLSSVLKDINNIKE